MRKLDRLIYSALISILALSCSNIENAEKQEIEYFKSGDLYYHVCAGNSTNAELVADTAGGNYTHLKGHLEIPALVEYNGIQYSVVSIGDSLFAGCEQLTSLTVSDGIKKIGNNAFEGCRSVTSVSLSAGLKEMGSRAFLNCESLKSVTLPEGLKEIKESAFFSCSSLDSICIPESIIKVGANAFDETLWIRNRPDGVAYVGNVAYKYISHSAEEVDIVLRKGTVGISDFAFFVHPEIQSITIPSSLTYIGMSAFLNCSGLSSIQLPYGVSELGKNAFSGCKSLVLVNLPESMNVISDRAFQNCRNLRTIRIPRNVTYIGKDAFIGCTSLQSITMYNSKPIVLKDTISKEIQQNVTLIVPDGAIKNYRNAEIWKDFSNIVEKDL